MNGDWINVYVLCATVTYTTQNSLISVAVEYKQNTLLEMVILILIFDILRFTQLCGLIFTICRQQQKNALPRGNQEAEWNEGKSDFTNTPLAARERCACRESQNIRQQEQNGGGTA